MIFADMICSFCPNLETNHIVHAAEITAVVPECEFAAVCCELFCAVLKKLLQRWPFPEGLDRISCTFSKVKQHYAVVLLPMFHREGRLMKHRRVQSWM